MASFFRLPILLKYASFALRKINKKLLIHLYIFFGIGRAMSFIFLFLCFFSNITHTMNNELSKPLIVSAQQDPKAYSFPSYLHAEDFVQKPKKPIFDNDPALTDELIESIYQAAPARVHTIIKASQAQFKSSDSFHNKCLLQDHPVVERQYFQKLLRSNCIVLTK